VTVVGVDAALFASLEPPRLAGAKCTRCGTVAFPAQDGCARCTGDDMAAITLPERGRLWTWTRQSFEPKPPYRTPATGFEPYGVGYVDLGEVIVEARLAGDEAQWEIGAPMRLTLLPVWEAAGTTTVTYAFAPAGEMA
jgi:uncharacterized OB-fold protein